MVRGITLKISLLLAASLALISCGEKDKDKIGEAQLCIDKATSATVSQCLEKIDGIDTEAANVLRCSAGFIEEGFTDPDRLHHAFEALGRKTNGDTDTLTFLSYIAFSSKGSAGANQTLASDTYAACVKSNAKGLILLGSMAMTATTLSTSLGSFTPGSGGDIKTAIGNIIGQPGSEAAIGGAVSATYQTSCATGQVANEGVCNQLDSILENASPPVDMTDSQAVGHAVLAYWQTLNP
jgi:hypothetical protein